MAGPTSGPAAGPAAGPGTTGAAPFDLQLPATVRFGAGRSAELPAAATGLGIRRAVLVTGSRPERVEPLRAALAEAGVRCVPFQVPGEPGVDLIRSAVDLAVAEGCDGVIGVGGGSALDAAKATAVLAPTGADPLTHLEVVGAGQPLPGRALPCIAVPTTAGTGSEVTRNAVLSAGEVKASLRGPQLLPAVALVDPDLLAGLPRDAIVAGGMDALTQLLEPLLSVRANPFSDALATEGLRRSARSLARAAREGLAEDGDLRADLALASLFSGLCLANSGLGVVHGIAAAAGARFAAPHGAVCAALLAPALAVNLAALRQRAPGHPALRRMADVAALLTGDPQASPEQAVVWVAQLQAELAVAGLARWGVGERDLAAIAAAAEQASSTRGNPLPLTRDELVEILTRAR